MLVETYKYSEPRATPSGEISLRKLGETAADCAVLAVATLLPVILYIRDLGIYADDWSMFARFRGHGDRTIAEYFRTFYSLPVTHSRPLMDLYGAILFRWFGVNPLGYHAVNAFVFFISALLLYLSIRLVLRERLVALSVPVLFLLLPNYSSARFVPFTFMIGLSLVFFFLNLCGMLKAVQGPTFAIGWSLASVAALILSGLAYEVSLPLFVVNLSVVWIVGRRKPLSEQLRQRTLALLLISNAAALIGVLIFKALRTMRYHGVLTLRDFVTQGLLIHFYKLGLRLPIVAAKVIFVYWNLKLVVLTALFGIAFFYYLWRLQRTSDDRWPSLRNAFSFLAFGFLVFTFGVSLFFVSAGSMAFTATGVENRTAVAASLGMAFIFSGLALCLGALSKAHHGLISSLLIAFFSASGLLATGTIGSFWTEAAHQQRLVLSSIKRDIPMLPAHSVLLVDGVCPYVGPGIVFEGGGDMGGSLQLLYQDPTLLGDVVSPRLRVHPEDIETVIYGRSRYYPYGPSLKVYDYRSKKVWDLTDATAAGEYFGTRNPAYTFCPEGNEGDGVPIF